MKKKKKRDGIGVIMTSSPSKMKNVQLSSVRLLMSLIPIFFINRTILVSLLQ